MRTANNLNKTKKAALIWMERLCTVNLDVGVDHNIVKNGKRIILIEEKHITEYLLS